MPDDPDVVANMVEMHELAADSMRAYERGATRERDRISKDVNDIIGARRKDRSVARDAEFHNSSYQLGPFPPFCAPSWSATAPTR